MYQNGNAYHESDGWFQYKGRGLGGHADTDECRMRGESAEVESREADSTALLPSTTGLTSTIFAFVTFIVVTISLYFFHYSYYCYCNLP